LSDASCTVDVGRVIGADYIVRNDITNIDNTLWLTVSMYSTDTGELLYNNVRDYNSITLLNFHLEVVHADQILSKMTLGEKSVTNEQPTIINQTVIDPYSQFRYERAMKRRDALQFASISLVSSIGVVGIGWGVKAIGDALDITFFSLRRKYEPYTIEDYAKDMNEWQTEHGVER
jgi:hypothetical protein